MNKTDAVIGTFSITSYSDECKNMCTILVHKYIFPKKAPQSLSKLAQLLDELREYLDLMITAISSFLRVR